MIEEYGDKITFWGGISTQQTLQYGTPEEVKKETVEMITNMSKKGGYITSTRGSRDVPVENILALLETNQLFA